MRKLVERLELGIEELILALLILGKLLAFFMVIPPTLEYVEKVIAIIAMCYLFYKASLTRIIFGRKKWAYDFMIVIAYILLSVKTVVGFIISAAEEESLVSGFYGMVIHNAPMIEKTGFWIGGLVLLVISYLLIYEKVKKPCLLGIIHEAKLVERAGQKIVRFLSIYLVLISIFVVVFMLAIEWLAVTVDAPIMMAIVFFDLFVIVKRGRGMKTESFLKKVSEASENFYSRFISFFHSRKTITIAITGLLVLHLLIDIGNFIIPYTTGLFYPKYFAQLGAGHNPLGFLMALDFAATDCIFMKIGIMLVYLFNIIAVLMLFIGPAYAWYYFHHKKRVKIQNVMWLFFGSLVVFIMQPLFLLDEIRAPFVLGVDITTQQIPQLANVPMVLLISVLVMGIFYILGRKDIRRTAQVGFMAVFVYFGLYLYYFFIDLAKYYTEAVVVMAQNNKYFIALHLLLFFVVTIMFYIGGYLMFLHEAIRKKRI
ncbi:hypothetical protein KY349_02060 [Candidatus Woesearchaeota archaeon]|nr:hypothetical protein [Candidatus Woesearchaeota archaeon]